MNYFEITRHNSYVVLVNAYITNHLLQIYEFLNNLIIKYIEYIFSSLLLSYLIPSISIIFTYIQEYSSDICHIYRFYLQICG
jgi:hypothetical protein